MLKDVPLRTLEVQLRLRARVFAHAAKAANDEHWDRGERGGKHLDEDRDRFSSVAPVYARKRVHPPVPLKVRLHPGREYGARLAAGVGAHVPACAVIPYRRRAFLGGVVPCRKRHIHGVV